MVFANDIRKAILALADQRAGGLFYLQEVEKLLDAENWPRLVDQVKLVAESLIQEGQIAPTRGDSIEIAYTKLQHHKEDH